jgi:hypothetical protein
MLLQQGRRLLQWLFMATVMLVGAPLDDCCSSPCSGILRKEKKKRKISFDGAQW